MPFRFKIPGYIGNGLVLLLGVTGVIQGDFFKGGLVAALGALNIYFVFKLEQMTDEIHELRALVGRTDDGEAGPKGTPDDPARSPSPCTVKSKDAAWP